MKEQVDRLGELYQSDAAEHLETFGDEVLAYYDDSGSLCIGKKVLAEFRKITPDLVWLRSEQYWRTREPEDEPGRMQS